MAAPDPDVTRILGNIEGSLTQISKSLDRHIDDDVRRFSELHKAKDAMAEDINKAKGAKGALLWVAGIVAGVVSIAAPIAAKAFGFIK